MRGNLVLSDTAYLQSQAYKFHQDTSSGRWWWTTYMDVSRATPSFRVGDIRSPYGVLRDSIPIPGSIIEAMAQSVETIKAQFPPSITVGPPSALVITVDEGRGFSLPEPVPLTNSGVFGSLLGATLTTSADYLEAAPSQIGGIPSNASATFQVSVDSTGLVAADSPYTETILASDPNATNSPQALNVSIVVRPKSVIEASGGVSFSVVKPISGEFNPIPAQSFVLENTGPAGSLLEWQLTRLKCLPWVASLGPTSGTLNSGESTSIEVEIAPPQSTLKGTYTEILRISGYSENQFVDVAVTLTIT